MAISLKLETRDQTYDIYGGSAGFAKIIQAVGIVDAELTSTGKLLEIFSDLDRRKAIVSILLDEGEFVPELDISTDRKKEAVTLKLAKQLDTGWIIGLISALAQELNDASTKLSDAVPAIAPQPDSAQESAIAHSIISTDGEIFTQSNITEGE